MRVFFNDLSIGRQESKLADNFDKVFSFSELIGHLNRTIGISLIATSENIYGLRLCDTQISECGYKKDFNIDQRNLIKQLINYFHCDSNLDKEHVFSHHTTGKTSILLGNAHKHCLPVISFTFEDEFSSDEINGNVRGHTVSIRNLYDKTQEVKPSIFISINDCKQFDPTTTPLWNTDATKAYHDTVKNELKSIALNPNIKIAILERHSRCIAELNGWELDEGLTRKNKNSNSYRRIFRSSKFTKGKGYLSIDFEKQEIHFELYNKKGKHLGEYLWDGTRTKESDPTGQHDIYVN